MAECLTPEITLLVKLGSALVHADEFFSSHGHPFDKTAFEQMINDPEVKSWIEEMSELALIPSKRSETERRK